LPTPPDGDQPLFAILDGGHPHPDSVSNPDVFFLEPLADFDPTHPNFDGMPNPNLMPTARVCQLTVGDGPGVDRPGSPRTIHPCGPADTVDLLMTYNTSGGFYQANLRDAGVLNPDFHYRIEIILAALKLNAFRDLDVDDGPAVAACADEAYCQVNRNGQGTVNVPIKVIIEENAACIAIDPTFDPATDACETATLNEGQTLVVEVNGQPRAAATPDQGATLSIQSCTDLRSRGSSIADHAMGRIDLKTWGQCVEINALDATAISGVAELCDAPGVAQASGLTAAQVERLTIHRHSVGDDFTVAMGHGEASNCGQPAPAQGQAYEFTRLQQFARLVRRSWRSVTDRLLPEPAMACNRGCAGDGEFESSYQAAGPAAWDYDASNLLGDLGAHDPGTIVTARANVFDSGEFEDGSPPSPDPYEDLRVTVTHTHPDATFETSVVLSDSDGNVDYTFTVEGGINTVEFEAIGVGLGKTDGLGNVLAPSIEEGDPAEVTLSIGSLTFTAIGVLPLTFRPDPPTGDFKLGSDELAHFDDLRVCGTPGTEITSLEAVKNNGTPVTFGGLVGDQELPVAIPTTPDPKLGDGSFCYTFENLTLDKTGAYRIVVNGEVESLKINVKP
jgi:hypothetical protein